MEHLQHNGIWGEASLLGQAGVGKWTAVLAKEKGNLVSYIICEFFRMQVGGERGEVVVLGVG